MHDEIIRALPARQGHFRLESGHHGERWLDLERLCLDPRPVQRLAAVLAARLAAHRIEVVCGPLVEGAFVALLVASELGVPFTYTERVVVPGTDRLFPVEYRVPRALRSVLRGRRVAIVNDVINAGSAVRGTFVDLKTHGAEPIAVGTLAVLGSAAATYAAEHKLALETLVFLPNDIWVPSECPLCARGVPLEDLTGPP